MRIAFSITAVVALTVLHLAALFALLHPKVSREYQAFFIDRVTTDWHVQHYQSTPEEGIELFKPGWPDFVTFSFGIARMEDFGRWTDTQLGLQAGFEFNRSFSGPVCVVLDAMPSASMRLHHLTMAFGDQRKDILLGQDENFRSYMVDYELPVSSTRLALLFPGPLPRVSHASPRQLGVGLKRILIFSQPCSSLSPLAVRRP